MVSLTDFVDYGTFKILFTFVICLNFYVFSWLYFSLACLVISYKLLRPLIESLFLTQLEPSGRGVFITGCDSGFGHKLAEHLDGLGFVVFASCLNEEGIGAKRLREIGSKRMHVLELNVAYERSVEKAGHFVKKHLPKKGSMAYGLDLKWIALKTKEDHLHFELNVCSKFGEAIGQFCVKLSSGQGLWAIVNNAGINSCCDIELTSVETYEKTLDINLYGAIRVCKQLLTFIRHSKGRIVNIASVHGWFSFPRWSIYESSKHGLETITDSLRLEMKKFGVGVSIIEPGAFRTSGGSPLHVQRVHNDVRSAWDLSLEEAKQGYGCLDDVLSLVFKPAAFKWPPGNNLMPIVKAIEHAIRSPYPYTRYMICGTESLVDVYVITAKLCKVLPTWIMDEFIAHWQNARKFRI